MAVGAETSHLIMAPFSSLPLPCALTREGLSFSQAGREIFIRKLILEAALLCANSKDCLANEGITQWSYRNRHMLRFQVTQKTLKKIRFYIGKKK
jgi:hypothetical protein